MPNTEQAFLISSAERSDIFADLCERKVLPCAGSSLRALKEHPIIEFIYPSDWFSEGGSDVYVDDECTIHLYFDINCSTQ